MIYISDVLHVILIHVLHFLNSISSFFSHFSAHIQWLYNRNHIFAKFSWYHPIFIVHVPHSDPEDTWLLCDHKENAQRTCSIAFLSLSNHAVPFWTTNISAKLIFLSFRICDSQTPNDKIVGKTQGNVYFFSVNGYQTSNTSYHTLLKFPLSPFFNVDICEA